MKSHREIKGETLTSGVNPPKPKTVYVPKEKRDQMNPFKKFLVKTALPFFIDALDVEFEVDKDEQINVVTYKVKVTLFGQTLINREKAETLPG